MNNILTEQLLLDVVKERESAGFGTEGRKPMKIKVGDWVTYKSTGEIARVRVVDNDKYINGVSIDDCIKLPIKFKGFNVLFRTDGDREVWDCYRTVKEIGTIHFICIFDSIQFYTGYKIKYEKFIDVNLQTAEEAELWLELQYATLLAKARGLV